MVEGYNFGDYSSLLHKGEIMAKKLIPCRICGKQFKPCSYCQDNSDVFRWRNFACSYECAKEYISKTTAYRENLNTQIVEASKTDEDINLKETAIINEVVSTTTKKKKNKASIVETDNNEIVDFEIENKKTD